MRVHAGARLQLEGARGLIEGPDAGERHVEMAHQCLGAALQRLAQAPGLRQGAPDVGGQLGEAGPLEQRRLGPAALAPHQDRKSTRLNSSHSQISYAVFCLKKKKKKASKWSQQIISRLE